LQRKKSLSGGEKTSVALAYRLALNVMVKKVCEAMQSNLLILDEPTRGIDVGTKAAVHELMSTLASQGMAILMISSELPEILGMSDRILVMNEGRLVDQFRRNEATQEKIIAAATASSLTASPAQDSPSQ